MKLRRVTMHDGTVSGAVWDGQRWIPLVCLDAPLLSTAVRTDLIRFLQAGTDTREHVAGVITGRDVTERDYSTLFSDAPMLPFEPRAYRDFMLYEKHVIGAATQVMRAADPALYAEVLAAAARGEMHPAVRPRDIWYQQPIYYFGNALNFTPSGAVIERPAYSEAMDYELELGCVLTRSALNAPEDTAASCIGGFVVFNDWSARDVQMPEMNSLFGPQKAKNFANSMSSELVTAEEFLPKVEAGLRGRVWVNGELRNEGTTAGMHHSLGRVVSFASMAERLHPGELFGTGTLGGCSGLEIGRFIEPGDVVRVELDGIGVLENTIGPLPA